MTGIALIAALVALASPVAHGPVGITCTPTVNTDGRAGQAEPWNPDVQIELTNDSCRGAARVILHRSPNAHDFYGFHVVLHEAAHVAQWRDGATTFPIDDLSQWWEHDAECRSWRATGAALWTLHYSRRFIHREVAEERKMILREALPYGGVCS